jgi:TonB family protein
MRVFNFKRQTSNVKTYMKHTLTLLALLLMCTSLSAQTGSSNRSGNGDNVESHGSTRNNNNQGGDPSFRNGGSADVFNSHNKTYSGKIYNEVTTAPSYPGGITEMLDYLDNNTSYPDDTDEEGTVYVQFVVETDGAVTNPTIVSGLNKECNAEALRVIKEMPKWTPGQLNGKAVRCYQKIGVRFYQ